MPSVRIEPTSCGPQTSARNLFKPKWGTSGYLGPKQISQIDVKLNFMEGPGEHFYTLTTACGRNQRFIPSVSRSGQIWTQLLNQKRPSMVVFAQRLINLIKNIQNTATFFSMKTVFYRWVEQPSLAPDCQKWDDITFKILCLWWRLSDSTKLFFTLCLPQKQDRALKTSVLGTLN